MILVAQEWLGQAGSVQDDDTESARAPRIHRVSPYEFQSLLLRGGTNAADLNDFPTSGG